MNNQQDKTSAFLADVTRDFNKAADELCHAVKEYAVELSKTQAGKILKLADYGILNEHRNTSSVQEDEPTRLIPVSAIVEDYPELSYYEIKILEELLNADVSISERIEQMSRIQKYLNAQVTNLHEKNAQERLISKF